MAPISGAAAFGWEFFGTAILLLFGNGVCAAYTLRTSAARHSSWLLISLGWGFAVFVGASIAHPSGGHLNPAVTISLALSHNPSVPWSIVPFYIAGQMLGAIVGALLTWLVFKKQFDANNYDEEGKETGANKETGTIFFTKPNISAPLWNCITEAIATFVLLSFILFSPAESSGNPLGPLKYFAIAVVIVAIGTSLGTPTGYAINPARDLGPRIAYSYLLPIPGKGSGEWAYSWVPIIGPLIGGSLAGALTLLI